MPTRQLVTFDHMRATGYESDFLPAVMRHEVSNRYQHTIQRRTCGGRPAEAIDSTDSSPERARQRL